MRRPLLFAAAGWLLAYACSACRPVATAEPPAAATVASRPAIQRIAAVRLFVTDIERARAFYGNVLGLPAGTGHELPVSARQRIELVPVAAPGPPNLLAGVVFATNDVARMRRYLGERGVACGPLVTDPAGAQRFDLTDPEGHPLSFEPEALHAAVAPPIRDAGEPVSRRLLHAGFVVRDRAALDAFYRDVLGFRMYWHGGANEADTDWVEIQVPDGEDWLEYMLNVPADAGHDERGVMNHFSLGVSSMPSAFERLQAHGYKGEDRPEIGRDGKWQFDIFDPDATRVEFMELSPTRAPCCHPYEAAHPTGP